MDEERGISVFKREEQVEAVFQVRGREMGPEGSGSTRERTDPGLHRVGARGRRARQPKM